MMIEIRMKDRRSNKAIIGRGRERARERERERKGEREGGKEEGERKHELGLNES